jgi:hypothetical protein
MMLTRFRASVASSVVAALVAVTVCTTPAAWAAAGGDTDTPELLKGVSPEIVELLEEESPDLIDLLQDVPVEGAVEDYAVVNGDKIVMEYDFANEVLTIESDNSLNGQEVTFEELADMMGEVVDDYLSTDEGAQAAIEAGLEEYVPSDEPIGDADQQIDRKAVCKLLVAWVRMGHNAVWQAALALVGAHPVLKVVVWLGNWALFWWVGRHC